jgi:predicted acyl esterase
MKPYLIIICFLITLTTFAQLTPVTVTIPMRDGKFLAADVYLPNNDSTPRPTILIQTPYNKNFYPFLGLPLQIGMNINSSPFNFVIVDWRCFYNSLAACITTPKRGEDGYDCVEWIATQQWSDGKIGTWGPSALGLIQFQTAKEMPSHLTCAAPIVSGMNSEYLRYFPGGVYRTEYVQMLDALGYGLSTVLLAHPVHDIYWTIGEASTFYPDSINVPMFMIGGWYDHATEEVLKSFEGIRTQSPMAVRTQHKLLMGPWTHNSTANGAAAIGELNYLQAAGASDSLARIFFDYYLSNIQNGWSNRPVVEYFQMGENTWQNDSAWSPSPAVSRDLYFGSSGTLSLNPPASNSDSALIVYDPRDPSPTVGGPTLLNTLNQGPYDQSPLVESRNDILSFTTDVLSVNAVMKGRPVAHLKVGSDMLDTDFSFRLTDVYPDGRSMLVLDGIRRMRFRNGYSQNDTSAMIPGTIYSVDIDLFANSAITFLAGHKIRVDISSSNYPRFDCNLNNGQQMYAAGDTLIAHNTIYMNSVNASYITLPVDGIFTAISEEDNLQLMNIYPNPADELIYVDFNSKKSTELKLYDVAGKLISTYGINPGSNKMDIRNLNSGIYFLRAELEGAKINRKIVVQ